MQITFGTANDPYVICHGATRNKAGDAIGPFNLRYSETPGTQRHEFIGADRVQNEHIRCDSGSVSFSVIRIFATIEAMLTYFTTTFKNEPKEGILKVGGVQMLGDRVTVRRDLASVVGAKIQINYTFEG